MNTNLRRWEICRHAVAHGSGNECTAQDGAHVAGHDSLLLHAAVVLQGEDHGVIGRLKKRENKETDASVLPGTIQE